MDGKQLRRVRKRLGLTQAQFAAQIGIAPNSLARLERDERTITEPLARLVRMLALPVFRPDSDGGSADWPKFRTRDVDVDGKSVPRRSRKGIRRR
jgi:transcriptional regulator with XRE-family HTH domain